MESVLERPQKARRTSASAEGGAGTSSRAPRPVPPALDGASLAPAPSKQDALPQAAPGATRASKNDAQLNVRLSSELKQAGDEALAAAGLTSSEAVRMLYAFAAAHAGTPDAVRRALSDASDEERSAQKLEREQKLDIAHKGRALIPCLIASLGIQHVPRDLREMTDEELEDAVYADEMRVGAQS